MNELVSVVVPIYNMESSLEECVQSILCQDYKNIEIILVDDGSKDGTYSICKKLENFDNRVKTVHTTNQGSGPARNRGISESTGNYIIFPDADDYLEPDAISRLIEGTQNGSNDLVIIGYRSLDEKGKEVLRKEYKRKVIKGELIRQNYSQFVGTSKEYSINGTPWLKLFDLRIIRKNGIEFPPLRRHQDTGFLCRYLTFAKSVAFVEGVKYIHYVNDLRKEWYKYPVNYIDCVIGLYDVYKETVIKWNPDDVATHNMINNSHICKVIKAIELTYSPKSKISKSNRITNVSGIVKKSNLLSFTGSNGLGYYQSIVLRQIKRGKYKSALLIVRIKVEMEKMRLISLLRGIQ